MNGKQVRVIADRVELEGFDYAFVHYSDFNEIKDEEFHKLRVAFLTARTALIDYIGLEDC